MGTPRAPWATRRALRRTPSSAEPWTICRVCAIRWPASAGVRNRTVKAIARRDKARRAVAANQASNRAKVANKAKAANKARVVGTAAKVVNKAARRARSATASLDRSAIPLVAIAKAIKAAAGTRAIREFRVKP